MIFYIVLAIYCFVKDCPNMGVFFFSIGFGIKAGAILLIPAMFGMIQYNHGTIQLIKSVVTFVAFTIIISLPFTYFGETELKEYLWKSKILGAKLEDLAAPS